MFRHSGKIMANKILIKRGTRLQVNTARDANQLTLGEPYLITDENRIAIATGSNSYQDFAKVGEGGTIDADLTAIAALTGTGILKRTGPDTWELDTNTYLTAESDTLGTVTGRGATTSTAVTFNGGITVDGTNAANFSGSTSGSAKLVAPAAAGTGTVITLPSTTGTLALTSAIPTVNTGTLSVSIGTAGATNTSITWGTASGFNANSSGTTTYDLKIGPAISNLATFMTTATAGFIKRTGQDTYAIDTSTYITGNQSISVSGDATGSGTTAIALTLASVGTAGTYTKVTTDAKGRVTSGTTLAATDIPTLTAAKISDFDTQVRTSRLDQMAAPDADVSLNNFKITGLATPTAGTDAANKNYVDSAVQGLDPKASVRAATTANITLSGTQTIDGVSLAINDRVLVKNQSTPAQNGIYIVAAGAWTRATDADAWNELISAFVFVEEGTTNADNGFVSTANAGGTIGVTDVNFVQFSGAGQITAGAGLTKTGNQLDVGGTTDRITVSADAIDISANYVGQTTITTLGTIATGTWNATAIGVTKGGLGLTAAVTGLLKGNGTAYSAATAGTDYLAPDSTIDGGTF
jgi:hypothetical protein